MNTTLLAVYKGHNIYRSNCTVGGDNGKPLRHLYLIDSATRYTAPAEVRDLGRAYRLGLTTIAACRAHISNALRD